MNLLKTSKKNYKLVCFVLIVSVMILSILSSCTFLDRQNNTKTNTNPAFQIKTLAEDTSIKKMEPEEVAELIMPSTVVILSYSSLNSSYSGVGSGVIMDSDGYIVTNAHVVKGSLKLEVLIGIGDFTTYSAKLIGEDELSDLAVIKIEPDNRTDIIPAKFGSANDLKVASQVLAVGSPGGMELANSVTLGIVSALNRNVTTSSGYTINCIQTDTAINPGNSGGPLVNMYGLVVGINSSKIAQVEYEGIGFSISINEGSLNIITELKLNGKYVRPALGITYNTFVSSDIATKNNWLYDNGTPINGIQILEITNPSLTSEGIKPGHIIIEVDGNKVTSTNIIASSLIKKSAGDIVKVKIFNPNETGLTGNPKIFEKQIKLIERK